MKTFLLIAVGTVLSVLTKAVTTPAVQVVSEKAKPVTNELEVYSVPLLPSLVTLLALFLYFVVSFNVGRARNKYKIPAPRISGDQDFERVLRVQQNTLEQLILFLPALWLFSWFINSLWGAAIGAVWIICRILYAWGYYQAAEKRVLGFGMSMLTTLVLLLGSLVGILLALFKTPL